MVIKLSLVEYDKCHVLGIKNRQSPSDNCLLLHLKTKL